MNDKTKIEFKNCKTNLMICGSLKIQKNVYNAKLQFKRTKAAITWIAHNAKSNFVGFALSLGTQYTTDANKHNLK